MCTTFGADKLYPSKTDNAYQCLTCQEHLISMAEPLADIGLPNNYHTNDQSIEVYSPQMHGALFLDLPHSALNLSGTSMNWVKVEVLLHVIPGFLSNQVQMVIERGLPVTYASRMHQMREYCCVWIPGSFEVVIFS